MYCDWHSAYEISGKCRFKGYTFHSLQIADSFSLVKAKSTFVYAQSMLIV